MEQIKAMHEEMEKDVDFGEEIAGIFDEGTVADVISAASKKGFKFTEAEWEAHREKEIEERGKILSEEELADVAGGYTPKLGDWGKPRKSTKCYWAHSSFDKIEIIGGAERRKCHRSSCKNYSGNSWYECRCWGTHACVRMMHSIHRCG